MKNIIKAIGLVCYENQSVGIKPRNVRYRTLSVRFQDQLLGTHKKTSAGSL